MAVDGRLQIDLPDTLERTDEEGVHGVERACMRDLDLAFLELGREAFEEANLFFGEFDLAFSGGFFEPQQAFVLGKQAVALPHAAHAAGGDLEAFKLKLMLDADSSMAGVGERIVEYGLLHLCGDTIGMRAIRPRQAVDEALGQ